MLPMAWFQFFTNRHFYEIVFIKKFPHNFECWNRPMPLLLPSHSSTRNAPPPVPLLLPSHSSSRPILSPVPRCKQTLWASGCSFICLKSINDRFQIDKCLGWQFADVCTPEIVRKVLYLCKRCFLIGKSPFSVASPPTKIEHIIDFSWEILNKSARAARKIFKYIHWFFLRILCVDKIRSRPPENLCVDKIRSRPRKNLCVDKIRSQRASLCRSKKLTRNAFSFNKTAIFMKIAPIGFIHLFEIDQSSISNK